MISQETLHREWNSLLTTIFYVVDPTVVDPTITEQNTRALVRKRSNSAYLYVDDHGYKPLTITERNRLILIAKSKII